MTVVGAGLEAAGARLGEVGDSGGVAFDMAAFDLAGVADVADVAVNVGAAGSALCPGGLSATIQGTSTPMALSQPCCKRETTMRLAARFCPDEDVGV